MSGLPISEARSAGRSPHDVEELLVLNLIRRVQADSHTAAIAQPFQQIIACARPQLVPQCQAPRILMVHARKLTT